MADIEFLKTVFADMCNLNDTAFNDQYGKTKDVMKQENPELNQFAVAEECPIE